MIDGMQIKSNRGFERSLNNYRSKYIRHLNYWKNARKTNHWITDENPLFSHQGKVLAVLSLAGRACSCTIDVYWVRRVLIRFCFVF